MKSNCIFILKSFYFLVCDDPPTSYDGQIGIQYGGISTSLIVSTTLFLFSNTFTFKLNSNCIFILKSFYFLVRGSKNPLDSKSDSLKEHPKSGDESIMRVEMLYGLETFYNYIFFSNTFTFKLNSNCIFIFQILLLSN